MKLIRIILLIASAIFLGWNTHAESASGEPDEYLRDIAPERAGGVSMATALALDLIVPGGGHFYCGNVYTGYVFAGVKLFAGYLVYYSYRDWVYRRSLYRAAKRANAEIDPNHELEFEEPGGGYNTVEEFRRDYDRAAQKITFSVLGTAAVYAVSLLMTYHSVQKINADCVPTFEIGYFRDILGTSTEDMITFSVIRRF
jgi:hypothetical protein